MIFLIFLSLFITINCYDCSNGRAEVYPPADLDLLTYYPSDWTDNKPIPTLDSKNCFLFVDVPYGYFANVSFYMDNGADNAGSTVIYPSNKMAQIRNNDRNPYIFPFPQFKVNIQSSKNSTALFKFAFKINWIRVPENTSTNRINVYRDKPPVVVQANSELTTFRTGTNSRVALMAFSLADPSQNFLLRQSVIYAGESFYAHYIGTLDQILTSTVPLTSDRSTLSIYTFGLSNIINYPLFMASDVNDVILYTGYEGANCPPDGKCNVILNGQYGNSMTVTYSNGSEIITGFDSFPSTAVINIYENLVSEKNKVASLSSSNYLQQLPLHVKGPMRFYELIGYGVYNMTVTRQSS